MRLSNIRVENLQWPDAPELEHIVECAQKGSKLAIRHLEAVLIRAAPQIAKQSGGLVQACGAFVRVTRGHVASVNGQPVSRKTPLSLKQVGRPLSAEHLFVEIANDAVKHALKSGISPSRRPSVY